MQASTTTRVLGVLSPVLLVGLGAYGVAASTTGPGPLLLAIGLALTAAVGFTIPWWSVVDGEGVRVRMPARLVEHRWDDVVAFDRHTGGRKGNGALLVRTVSGRKTALRDVAERPAEWDTLRELVSQFAPGVAVAGPPPGHPFRHQG